MAIRWQGEGPAPTGREPPARSAMSGPAPGGLEEDLPARSRLISPSLLLPAEAVVFELKPSLWYVAIVSLPIMAAGLALMVLAYFIRELGPWRYWGLVIGVWVVGLRVAVGFLQWLGRTYVLTDRRILKQHGVINVRVQFAGLEEIDSAFVAQAAFQRLVGIGTLFFRCERSSRDVHTWEHVRRPREVHAHVVAQIERWKHTRAMTEKV